MIQVQILFFAALRESMQTSELLFQLKQPVSVQDLLQQAAAHLQKKVPDSLPLSYALNQEFVSKETLVQDGDSVAYLPPMAGG